MANCIASRSYNIYIFIDGSTVVTIMMSVKLIYLFICCGLSLRGLGRAGDVLEEFVGAKPAPRCLSWCRFVLGAT